MANGDRVRHADLSGNGLPAKPSVRGRARPHRQDNVIHIAWRADAPPFSYKNDNGQPAGFMVDLCQAVVRRLAQQLNLPSLQTSYVTVTAVDRFDAIQQNKADLALRANQQHSVAPQARGFLGNDVR